MTGNIASWKVLEKLGMKRMEIMMDGEPAYLYKGTILTGPVFSVQTSGVYGFCEVFNTYIRSVCKICYRSGYFQDPVIGSC